MCRSVLISVLLSGIAINSVSAEAIYRLSAFNCAEQGIHNDAGVPSAADCIIASTATGTAAVGASYSVAATQGTKLFPSSTDEPNHFYARSEATFESQIDPGDFLSVNLRIFNEVELQNYEFDTYTSGLGTPGTYDLRRTASGFAGVSYTNTYTVTMPDEGISNCSASAPCYFRPKYLLTGTMFDDSFQTRPTINICDGLSTGGCFPSGLSQDGPLDEFTFYSTTIQSPLLPVNMDNLYRITIGVPFDFTVSMYSWIYMPDANPLPGFPGGTYNALASVDFLHTLTILQYDVTDANGNLIPGAVVTTVSEPGPTPVPEPTQLLLLGIGLTGMLAKRRYSSRG